MKTALHTHFAAAFVLTKCALAGDGVIDLTRLLNYEDQPVPAYISRDNTPPGNPITNAGATLGRVLFHDKRLSRNSTVSCASCHDQAHAFGDTALASTGVAGTTGRHSMRLVNARFSAEPRFFWDERATSLENQTTQPIRDHVEMGFSGADGDPAFSELVTRLSAIEEYRVLFAMTYGSAVISETRIQRSLAQFVRSIQSFDSKYDAGRAINPDNQPFPNFTPQENNGKTLFLNPPAQGGAGCAGCHAPPEFAIDPNSRNNGVTGMIGGGTDLTNTRSPSLRDLVGPGGQSHGAFMHNGVFATLDQVINHYNAIPADNPNLDPRLRRPGGVQRLNLDQTQRDSLAAFLRTLSGNAIYQDERWSDPFTAEGSLELIVLPEHAATIRALPGVGAVLRCVAVPGLAYELQESDTLGGWETIQTHTANEDGVIEVTVPAAPPARFYRFAYTPPGS